MQHATELKRRERPIQRFGSQAQRIFVPQRQSSCLVVWQQIETIQQMRHATLPEQEPVTIAAWAALRSARCRI